MVGEQLQHHECYDVEWHGSIWGKEKSRIVLQSRLVTAGPSASSRPSQNEKAAPLVFRDARVKAATVNVAH